MFRPEEFIHPEAAYIVGSTYAAMVVRARTDLRAGLSLAWISPAEVRLLAALALAIPEDRGIVSFCPSPPFTFPGDLSSLNAAGALDGARWCAEQLAHDTYGNAVVEFHDWDEGPPGVESALFEAIDLNNGLLVRSLYCFLKSMRLIHDDDLYEEAFMNIQIAREGALQLVQAKLRTLGYRNPSFEDAHSYLESGFILGAALVGYFREQHDLWIETRHPSSRFGELWTPPLQADDIFETYEALVSVFRHLITSEPGRSTFKRA